MGLAGLSTLQNLGANLYREMRQNSSSTPVFGFIKDESRQGTTTMKAAWFVYMIRTASGTLYTGISTDPERRLAEHSGDSRGAKSLRGKGPLELVFSIPACDRSEASRLEARIKKLPRSDKNKLVCGNQELLSQLRS